jgi:hypothetical protein
VIQVTGRLPAKDFATSYLLRPGALLFFGRVIVSDNVFLS